MCTCELFKVCKVSKSFKSLFYKNKYNMYPLASLLLLTERIHAARNVKTPTPQSQYILLLKDRRGVE